MSNDNILEVNLVNYTANVINGKRNQAGGYIWKAN